LTQNTINRWIFEPLNFAEIISFPEWQGFFSLKQHNPLPFSFFFVFSLLLVTFFRFFNGFQRLFLFLLQFLLLLFLVSTRHI